VVGVSGSIEGDITCQNADFSGQVKAVIHVKELLSLKATSKVTGEVHTSKLAIEPGAKFSGTCNMEDEAELKMQKDTMQHGPINKEKEKITG
jgi:cytoskeletal protein CcmA (bactofilin family)